MASIAGALLLVSGGAASPLPGQPAQGAVSASSRTPDPLIAGISRWDVDLDDVLACQEWKHYAEQQFRRSDKNGDGMLDWEEFSTLGQYEPIFAKVDLGYFDDNQDGRRNLREFADKPNPVFALYDRNRDSQLTANEVRGSGPSGNRYKPPPGGPKGSGKMPARGPTRKGTHNS